MNNTTSNFTEKNTFISFSKGKHMQMQNKKKSHTEVHSTEISQSSHDRKVGHACRMTKKGHILID